MEKSKKIVCPSDFDDKIRNRIIDYQNRLHELYEYAVLKNGLTDFYNDVIDKIRKKKNIKASIYRLLECFSILSPNYTNDWLLYGKTATFLTRYKVLKDNSIISKYYPEHKFIEIVNILLIDNSDYRDHLLKCNFEKDYNDFSYEGLYFGNVDRNKIHDLYPRILTEQDIKEEFLDHYASMNRLKKIIPGFNEAWLLFGEGDMFEKK